MEQASQPWYEGPFKIIEKMSLVTFWLKMPSCVKDRIDGEWSSGVINRIIL